MADNNKEKVTPEMEVKPEETVEEKKTEAAPEVKEIKKEEPKKEEKAEQKKPDADKKEAKKSGGKGKKIGIIIGIIVAVLIIAVLVVAFIFSGAAKTAYGAKNYTEAYDKLSFPGAGLLMSKKDADTIKYKYVTDVLAKSGDFKKGAAILDTISTIDVTDLQTGTGFGLCEVGNVATLGKWEQDGDNANGEEALEWIVLDVKNDKAGARALIMTKKAIGYVKSWTQDETDLAYANSEVNGWCEVDFYKTFQAYADVKNRALRVRIETEDNPNGSDSGEAVEVYSFVLSAAEFDKYLIKNETLAQYAKAEGTASASKLGVRATTAGFAGYWLRTAGESTGFASAVTNKGEVSYGSSITSAFGIRPCMWISLEAAAK